MDDRSSPAEHLRTLAFALEKYPQRVRAVDLGELVIESARQNPKRPAYVKVAVPDDWVKSLRGARDGATRLLLVELPHEVAERSASSIILPGEV